MIKRKNLILLSQLAALASMFALAGESSLLAQVINPVPANPGPYPGPPFIHLIESLPDGKIVLAGSFQTFTGLEQKELIRLQADGTLDESFVAAPLPAGPYGQGISALLALPDGKLLVGLNSSNGIIRLNADGSRDETFRFESIHDQNLYNYPSVLGILWQTNGQLVAFGNISQVGTNEATGIVRLHADGRVDPTFLPRLTFEGKPASPTSALVQPDGKIVLTGGFDAVNGTPKERLARLNSDGSLDTSFASPSNWSWETFDVQHDGKILVRGTLGISRLTRGGTWDYSFNPGLGVSGTNRYLVSGKSHAGGSLIYGNFDKYDDQWRRSLARLNDDGSLDRSFDAQLAKTTWAWSPEIVVRAVKVLPDGSFLAAGTFTEVQGKSRTGLARFTAEGELDERFNPFRPALREPATTANGLAQFRVVGEARRPYAIEVSEDLKSWRPVRNFMITDFPFFFIDSRELPARSFYRIVSL
jgi:uncharacterized delta-60 repeat protein